MNTLIKISSDTKTLDFAELKNLGTWDNAKRWYPIDVISEYFDSIRTPSRSWNHSYFNAAKTQKFLKWLKANHAELINVSEEVL